MKKRAYDRRQFIKTSAMTGIGIAMAGSLPALPGSGLSLAGKRIGIIGLDTSHSVEFTKELNSATPDPVFLGYKIVAAYPQGSRDIESSVKRIPAYIEEVKKLGVEIVDSIGALLLEKVDVVLLETNDGRPHLEQALPVLKAGKTLFIDKPVAASLADVLTIFAAAEHYRTPIFSSSSLRYIPGTHEIKDGKIGNVLGADAFSPCMLEKTHPDFYWYGIHGVEILFTVMGSGCKEVERVSTPDTDVAVGTWMDGRIGTFRGTRTGQHLYGGTVYGEKGNTVLGPFDGYKSLLTEIIRFFDTGKSPVSADETLEIYVFMEAADESKRRDGKSVNLQEIRDKAKKESDRTLKRIIG